MKNIILIAAILILGSISLNAQTMASNWQPSGATVASPSPSNTTATFANSFKLTDDVGFTKREIMINTFAGTDYFFGLRAFPSVSLEFESRFLNQMFDEGGSPIGIGPVFGYSQYKSILDGIFGERIPRDHEAYGGLAVTAHLIEVTDKLIDYDLSNITQYVDLYLSYAPIYEALLYSDGDVIHGLGHNFNVGARLYYKAIGLNLAVGRVASGGASFEVGVAFKKLSK